MAATLQPRIAAKDPSALHGSSLELGSYGTLEEIALTAQHLTAASGAALVLSDGQIMSCRACCGDLVPPLGTRLNTDTGFTASCVRTAEGVRCDDTQTDPRVDASSCIELGIRSILAVPVFNGQNVTGVLEVLSTERTKFTDRHAAALKLLARLVETLINDDPRGEVPLNIRNLVQEPQGNNPAATSTDGARVTCLSCGHSNPQDSQFCNRCGVILLVSPGPQDTSPDRTFTDGIEASTDEDLKEIDKLIAGSAGLATWDEIYAKLLASMETISAPEKPHAATIDEPASRSDTVIGFGKTQGVPELKPRLGGVVRRSLWL